MNLVDEYYQYIWQKVSVNDDKRIAYNVLNSLLNRAGFDDIWDSLEEDTQAEIITDCIKEVEKVTDT